ncbi:MAG: energy-coupling factor transporter transmembrane protein EcfT [Candidatus Odinarchaeota archaeon]|nr:energy-coupling factor transporter transmembrane protein EcfT [Candidatus Odinarchaeota archaeon]
MSLKVDYIPGNTIFHRAHPVTKIIFTLVLFFWLFSTRNLASVLIDFVIILIIAAYVRIPLRFIKSAFTFGLPLGLILLITQPLVYSGNKTPIISPVVPTWVPFLGGMGTFYLEGLIFGIVLIVRLYGILILMPVLILTTPAADFVIGLTQVGLPYDYAFITMMALRFLPVLSDTRERILEAQRLRALEFEKAGFMTRMRRQIPLIVPLIVNAMRVGEELEVAIESRAFGSNIKRTYYRPLVFSVKQKLISAFSIAFYILLLVYHYLYVKNNVVFPLPFELPIIGNQLNSQPVIDLVLWLIQGFYWFLNLLYVQISAVLSSIIALLL